MHPANIQKADAEKGYTLIELIVVIALIGILLSFTIPRFHGSLLSDNSNKTVRRIVLQVQHLRQNAVRSRKMHTLHISPDSRKMWVTNEGMSEEDAEAAADGGEEFPEDVDITDVEYPDDEKISYGEARIRFSPKGYSDKVMIHLENTDGERKSLLIEPFLPNIEIFDDYVEFEN
ncbi:MAG: type II secretion system protein [Desulfococcaceae bacterium]|jgi:prepilin-type N-terminal cleavage/methylation domain-containing protein|nr:type II secretion system protein [Desulfococcaceae bacterium]